MKSDTMLGAIAILFWSTTVAFSRSLTEALGTLSAAASIYVLAGVLSCAVLWRTSAGRRSVRNLPGAYLIGCGGLFVLYLICLNVAVGLAQDREQVIVVGLINYLWPSLSLLFSVPILKLKARPHLAAGIALALGGVWLAAAAGQGRALGAALFDGAAALPYALALVGAVSWALYSNLSRRWAAGSAAGAVPLFLLASGLTLAVLRLFVSEQPLWTVQAGLGVAYTAIFPGVLAATFWDRGVRNGDIVLLSALSYLTPLLSTLVSMVVLGVAPAPLFWLAVALVIAGAVVCTTAIVGRPADAAEG